jgi:lysophospholipid acyltransferase (LPLAT)-like uncharacterized protein
LGVKRWWRGVRPKVLSGLAYWFVRLLTATVRVRSVNFPGDPTNCVFCGWHGKSVLFANRFRGLGWWVIISHSKDGEIQSHIFTRLGYQIIRGSTGRGGVRAAIEAIKALKAGGTMAMTPDGPRGPSGVVQGGVMLMATKSGARLIPVGISARPRVLFNSWDRYLIPLPFSRAVILFGEPLTVPTGADEETIESVRLQLQEAIHTLEAEADRRLGL